MSQLKTYTHPIENAILSYDGNALGVHLAPGTLVRHADYTGTKGMLIANGDDFLTVLWSIPPSGMTHNEKILAKQIADELDTEILRDLTMMHGIK